MEHDDRRKELGKMLFDVAKYLATVGLIGGILTNKLSVTTGLSVTVVTAILAGIAFYTIPTKSPGVGWLDSTLFSSDFSSSRYSV